MFIRTKDNVYEIESDYLNNKGVRVGYNVVGQEEVVLIENNNVIQSDTIEDLCDCFLIFCKNKIHYYDDLGEAITFYTHKYKNKGGRLFGGIVVSTGINFVCVYKDDFNKLELDQIKINIGK